MPDDYEVEVAELNAIVQRDVEAFSRWFARCELSLKASLRSFAPIVDVEAITQDTVLRLWSRASRITPDGRPGFLLRWSRTVAVNAARTAARRASHPASGNSDVADVDVADNDDSSKRVDPFLRRRVERCLEGLSQSVRRVVHARVSDRGKRADRELAAVLGLSFDSFRKAMERGRRALEKCLESFNIDIREYIR